MDAIIKYLQDHKSYACMKERKKEDSAYRRFGVLKLFTFRSTDLFPFVTTLSVAKGFRF